MLATVLAAYLWSAYFLRGDQLLSNKIGVNRIGSAPLVAP